MANHPETEPLPRLDDDDVVDSIPVAAKASNLSIPTLRREIKKPGGPKVTQLSSRRIGITRRHRREGLARRARVRHADASA